MSILNTFVTPTRALVGVDTAAHVYSAVDMSSVEQAANGAVEVSKLIPLPHANALIAGRGVSEMLIIVFASVMSSRMGFDEAFLAMDKTLEISLQLLRQQIAGAGLQDPTLIHSQEIVFVGWSQKLNQVIGVRYTKAPNEDRFAGRALSGWGIAPGGQWTINNVPPCDTRESMTRMMQEQVSWLAKTHSSEGFGGRPIIAEITKNRIDTTLGETFAPNSVAQ